MILGLKEKLQQMRSAITIIKASLGNPELQFILFKDYGIKVSMIKKLVDFNPGDLEDEDNLIATVSSLLTSLAIKLIQKNKTLKSDVNSLEYEFGTIDKEKVNSLIESTEIYDKEIYALIHSKEYHPDQEQKLLNNLKDYRSTLKVLNALRG